MQRLVEHGLDRTLRARIAADRPTIAICVGHQLLFETSDENPGVRGLGLVHGHVGRFPDDVRVPQFGWNEVRPHEDARCSEGGYAYFANSYRATEAPGWTVAHGRPMAARSWPPWSAATSSAASSIPSSPAPMARRCWRASWSCG